MGRASGRTDIGVEWILSGQRLRREPASTDARPYSLGAATRWIVSAFTCIFFSPLTGDGAVHRQVVTLIPFRVGETSPIIRPSLAKKASVTVVRAQSAPSASI